MGSKSSTYFRMSSEGSGGKRSSSPLSPLSLRMILRADLTMLSRRWAVVCGAVARAVAGRLPIGTEMLRPLGHHEPRPVRLGNIDHRGFDTEGMPSLVRPGFR